MGIGDADCRLTIGNGNADRMPIGFNSAPLRFSGYIFSKKQKQVVSGFVVQCYNCSKYEHLESECRNEKIY